MYYVKVILLLCGVLTLLILFYRWTPGRGRGPNAPVPPAIGPCSQWMTAAYRVVSDSRLRRSCFSSSLTHLWRCRDTICSNCSRPFITFCHGRSIDELLITCTPETNPHRVSSALPVLLGGRHYSDRLFRQTLFRQSPVMTTQYIFSTLRHM